MSERTRLGFRSGGVDCAAYLYKPEGASGGLLPCVVMGHGASGTMDSLFPIAERIAAAGMAALVFDYREGTAERLRMPLLVCVADRDVNASPRFAEYVANRAPRGEVKHYPAGHFDV